MMAGAEIPRIHAMLNLADEAAGRSVHVTKPMDVKLEQVVQQAEVSEIDLTSKARVIENICIFSSTTTF